MKALLLVALCLPLNAAAADYVEAVQVDQITGLENSYPGWSADGTRIVFQSTRDAPDADIFLMNADGTNVVQLTHDAWEDSTPVLTPDGRYVVYATECEGNEDIIRIRADGRRIWFNSNRSSDPATFALGTMDRSQNHEIYSMTLDGA